MDTAIAHTPSKAQTCARHTRNQGKLSPANIIKSFWKIDQETTTFDESKSAVPPRQCTGANVFRHHGKNPSVGLQIATPSRIFSEFTFQQLFPISKRNGRAVK